MSSISSFDIIRVIVPEPKTFLFIHASAADTAAVNPNGIKKFLGKGLIIFFIKGNPVFNNEPRRLPRNPPDCIILDNRVFKNLMSADELFAKALRRSATCLLVNYNSCGKLVSSSELPVIFYFSFTFYCRL